VRRSVELAVYLGAPLAVLAAWWALTAFTGVDPFLLPAPPVVAGALLEILADPETYPQLFTTALEIGGAFLIAAAAGVTLGIPIGWYRLSRLAYEPVLANVYAIPLVILYPVIALLFGIGSASKVAFGALYGFFPIVLATVSAVALVDATLVSAGRSMGARGPSLLRVVVLPAALPRIMTGLRLGLILATLAVVGGEFIAGREGLGYLLATSGQAFRTVDTFAYIVLTLGLAASLNGLMAGIDRLTRRSLS
jgi:ABC-type nitrate/sulfonate/bicarbonate transport system permease component